MKVEMKVVPARESGSRSESLQMPSRKQRPDTHPNFHFIFEWREILICGSLTIKEINPVQAINFREFIPINLLLLIISNKIACKMV